MISLSKKKPFNEHDRKDAEGTLRDNPENIPTEKESIYDMDDDMQFVDAIPVEDLGMELEEEKNHRETKNDSSTEKNNPGS